VRGSFFAEYIRMLRRRKDIDWSRVLPPEDIQYLRQRIEADEWYPMATFERLGVAILATLEGATLDAVRLWGRFSASQYAGAHAELIAPNEPRDTMMRLKVFRGTFFDFPAFDIPMLTDSQAYVSINYQMGKVAEEAACMQTLGFCEGVLSLAGARDVRGTMEELSWQGHARTRLNLEWELPEPPSQAASSRRGKV
jgi:hypothetical protein